jgi:hypothetical protein
LENEAVKPDYAVAKTVLVNLINFRLRIQQMTDTTRIFRVRVQAMGLNRADLLWLANTYSNPK